MFLQQQIKQTQSDLVHLLVADECHWMERADAAEKLIAMWAAGQKNGITLDHLAYVARYAEELHATQAKELIRAHSA